MGKKKLPDQMKMTFHVDPHQSAAHLCYSSPEGYMFESLSRKGTKAVVTYRRRGKA